MIGAKLFLEVKENLWWRSDSLFISVIENIPKIPKLVKISTSGSLLLLAQLAHGLLR